MELTTIIGVCALIGAGISGGLFFYFLQFQPKANFRSLMTSPGINKSAEQRQRLDEDETGAELDKLKKQVKKRKKKALTIEERMFQAGMFTDQEKKDFRRLQILSPTVGFILGPLLGYIAGGGALILYCGLIGAIAGIYLPLRSLDSKKKRRDEDILFYLPLVVEQIAIGVSSSLDTGPCIQRVVQMADERDNHNPVTELLRYAEYQIRSGVSLEEALTEIGELSGQTELKHTFLSLAQVNKYGGEVTKQLQELADSVSSQRETKVETKIKKLELEATLPVTMVFAGFLVILLAGFGTQVMKAFK